MDKSGSGVILPSFDAIWLPPDCHPLRDACRRCGNCSVSEKSVTCRKDWFLPGGFGILDCDDHGAGQRPGVGRVSAALSSRFRERGPHVRHEWLASHHG
jgi:hypothetical protein